MAATDKHSYIQGSLVRLGITFFDINETPSDPTTVTLKIENPDKAVSEVTFADAQVVRVSTGVYTYNLYLNVPGKWSYRWEAGGAVMAAAESFLRVTKAIL